MYEYKYAAVTGEGVSVTKYREHRDIIDRYAQEGWRYVGYLPTHITAHGSPAQLDLIFEREC